MLVCFRTETRFDLTVTERLLRHATQLRHPELVDCDRIRAC